MTDAAREAQTRQDEQRLRDIDSYLVTHTAALAASPYGWSTDQIRFLRRLLDEARAEIASDLAATRRTIRLAGHVVPVANVQPSMASEAGEILCKELSGPEMDAGLAAFFDVAADAPRPLFAATYHDGADGRRHFTLLSPEGGADVGALARRMAAESNRIANHPHIQGAITAWDKRFMDKTWTASGSARTASFDSPLGWEGE